MKVEIRNSPAYAVARCFLDPGQVINVESGAMYAQTIGMEITSEMQGGFLGALKRSVLSGDSFFVSKFSAPHGGWVDVVPTYPGDIFQLDLDGSNALILTRGAWIASDTSVSLDTKFGGAKMFIGGEGLFTVKCTGRGTVVGAAYGAIDHHSLKQGEGLTVDTGHLVAYEDGMNVNIRKSGTGILNSLKSGEGLVMDFYGPGDVITQSRNPQGFASFVSSLLPNRSS
ncbi:MAG: TIGR00266 family protein [Enterococcus sp.]|nr:TIGR00266 family protein [Enterococcus sp.]